MVLINSFQNKERYQQYVLTVTKDAAGGQVKTYVAGWYFYGENPSPAGSELQLADKTNHRLSKMLVVRRIDAERMTTNDLIHDRRGDKYRILAIIYGDNRAIAEINLESVK